MLLIMSWGVISSPFENTYIDRGVGQQHMKLYDIAEQSLDLLDQFLENSYSKCTDKNDYRLTFIYRHARNIWDLGSDCLFLDVSERTSGAYVLVRPLLESLFNLVAAVNNDAFAIEKYLYEIDHDIDKIAKWRALNICNGKSPMDDVIPILQAERDKIMREHSTTKTRNWNAFETAEEARLGQQYVQDYFMFSRHTHSSVGGIVVQEHVANRHLIQQSLVFTVLAALGHAAQILPNSSPQKYIDGSVALLKETVKIMEDSLHQTKENDEPGRGS